ncbi:SPASM domain-containing protein [bacterium]|nr:SPASM domain-containing protein [bacterium]
MNKKFSKSKLKGLSSKDLNPTKPEHNIVEMSEISVRNSSFNKCFPDGSPFFTWVEISITDLCNRKCVFCPRADPNVYPNNNEEISLKLYKKILIELASYGWEGGVAFAGFGEPLLHSKLLDLVLMTKVYLPKSYLEIVSNGDRLTAKICKDLYKGGLDMMRVSLYDGSHQIPTFEQMRKDTGEDEKKFILRYRYNKEDNYGLILSNRAGTLNFSGTQEMKLPLKKECYFPFYKLMIDYNGRVILCSHDWWKKLSGGDLNKQSIFEVWTGKVMQSVRKRLQCKNRNFSPCVKCDVDGTLNGESEFQRFLKMK